MKSSKQLLRALHLIDLVLINKVETSLDEQGRQMLKWMGSAIFWALDHKANEHQKGEMAFFESFLDGIEQKLKDQNDPSTSHSE